jgi:hypothetical protein
MPQSVPSRQHNTDSRYKEGFFACCLVESPPSVFEAVDIRHVLLVRLSALHHTPQQTNCNTAAVAADAAMAVLLETSKGDIVIDLYVDEAPSTCKNFLKLCK